MSKNNKKNRSQEIQGEQGEQAVPAVVADGQPAELPSGTESGENATPKKTKEIVNYMAFEVKKGIPLPSKPMRKKYENGPSQRLASMNVMDMFSIPGLSKKRAMTIQNSLRGAAKKIKIEIDCREEKNEDQTYTLSTWRIK